MLTAVAQFLGKAEQRLLSFLVEFGWDVTGRDDDKVAPSAAPQLCKPLPFNHDFFADWAAFRNFDGFFGAIDIFKLDLAAQDELRVGKCQGGNQIIVFAMEHFIWGHLDGDEQVACGAIESARIAFARHAQFSILVNPGRDVERKLFVLLHTCLSAASAARIGNLKSLSMAGAAWLVEGEKALLQGNRAMAVAGAAYGWFCSLFAATAFAAGAWNIVVNFKFFFAT